METSKPYKLILFKKENCAPCMNVGLILNPILEANPKYRPLITVLQKEHHTQLVKEYNLNMYPTLIILDRDMNEISRKVGQKSLTHEFFWKALFIIHRNRTS